MLRSRLTVTAAFLLLVALLAGCGDDGPSDYSDATRDAFMAGCLEDNTDPDLADVCECTYDTAVDELPFEQFQAAERRLQQGSTDIPDEISEIIIECIRQVSATRS